MLLLSRQCASCSAGGLWGGGGGDSSRVPAALLMGSVDALVSVCFLLGWGGLVLSQLSYQCALCSAGVFCCCPCPRIRVLSALLLCSVSFSAPSASLRLLVCCLLLSPHSYPCPLFSAVVFCCCRCPRIIFLSVLLFFSFFLLSTSPCPLY